MRRSVLGCSVVVPCLVLVSCVEPFRCEDTLTCEIADAGGDHTASNSGTSPVVSSTGPTVESTTTSPSNEPTPGPGANGVDEGPTEPISDDADLDDENADTDTDADESDAGDTSPTESADGAGGTPAGPMPGDDGPASGGSSGGNGDGSGGAGGTDGIDDGPVPNPGAGGAVDVSDAGPVDTDPETEPGTDPDEPDAGPPCACEGNGICIAGQCVDACAEDNGGCDALAECSTTLEGTAQCGACPAGYAGDGTTGCAPTLLDLGPSHGSLSPELEPGLDTYDLVVPVFIQNVTLTPSLPAGATATIRGAAVAAGASWTSPALVLGLNEFELTVEQAGQPSSEYTLRVTRGADEIAYLKASNTGEGDGFGSAVALSTDGNTLAVSAPYESSSATGVGGDEDDDDAEQAGAVYVFVRNGTNWSQQAYVKASNAEAGDSFGTSVSLSADGDRLAVGASRERSDAMGTSGSGESNNDASSAGAVYVFDRSGTGWSQRAYLKASNTGTSDFFGHAVALSADGTTLAVGAFGEDSSASGTSGSGQSDNAAPDAGAVYVFTNAGSTWTQQAYLKSSNPDPYDRLGFSIAMSGDGHTIAAGADYEDSSATGTSGMEQDDNTALSSGAVYVFARNGSSWSQQAYLKASNSGSGDYFGQSVAVSSDGDTVAVGAHNEGSDATGTDGTGQDSNDAVGSGAVYVFVRSGNTWSQQAYLKASNTEEWDAFGYSVGLSSDGNTLAAASRNEDGSAIGVADNGATNNDAGYAGAIYVFQRNGTTWKQTAYVKATNTDADDRLGTSLALSADGSVLVGGATGEDSNATGTSGTGQSDNSLESPGAVYVYR